VACNYRSKLLNGHVQLRKTIAKKATVSGVGLHSGNKVTLTLIPAEVGSGIRFRRVDLQDRPEIPAVVENVVDTTRATTLGKGSVRIHTVEHLLSALSGLEIDDVIVELDANEPPVGDGSAKLFCDLIDNAGTVSLNQPREPFVVNEPVKIEVGESMLTVLPHDGFRITCTSADQKGRYTQFYSLDITPESWRAEISRARTFCFMEEIEYLIQNGLIKGGSLENAVIILDDAVLTTEPMRYPQEFARHKILDLIGDLCLLGRPIRGHVIAVKPNHTANIELVRALLALERKTKSVAQAFALPVGLTTPEQPKEGAPVEPVPTETVMDIMRVMKILPHRYPFLMIDRVARLEENRIVAIKNVSINEEYFQGHFPGHPIMPGVLQLEAIAQAAGILMFTKGQTEGKLAYFMSAEEVKWRKPVRPGDTLVIEVELTRVRGRIGRAKGVCKVNGEIVSEAQVTFMLQDA